MLREPARSSVRNLRKQGAKSGPTWGQMFHYNRTISRPIPGRLMFVYNMGEHMSDLEPDQLFEDLIRNESPGVKDSARMGYYAGSYGLFYSPVVTNPEFVAGMRALNPTHTIEEDGRARQLVMRFLEDHPKRALRYWETQLKKEIVMTQRYPLIPHISGQAGLAESLDEEVFPDIDEEAHVVFFDEKGKIRAGCFFGEDDQETFDLGLVPEDVALQGPPAVSAWAEQQKDVLVARERQQREDRTRRIQELRREVEVYDRGVRIRGVVTKGPNEGPRANFVKMNMVEPFQLEKLLVILPCDFGSSVAGRRTFDDDGNLLQQEIERQNGTLIEMYRQEVRRRNKPQEHPALAGLPRGRSPRE